MAPLSNYFLLGLFLAVFSSACGMRSVARPKTAAGYEHVELKDVAALGLEKKNVEIVATLGSMVSQEVCGGIITFTLMDNQKAANGMTISMGGAVTLTIPRTRYAEVRDLHPSDAVRVRGYLSKYFAQGCSWEMLTSNRLLWVDTIERLPAPPPAQP